MLSNIFFSADLRRAKALTAKQRTAIATKASKAKELRRLCPMHERIQSISHQGKQVILADLSRCSAVEVEQIVRAVPDYVTAQPLGSVLLLVDFTGALFDQQALRAMKECAVFDKHYIKKSTWVGAGNLPHAFEKSLKAFSKREFPTFETREEALNWLVGD
jgi:hypothetical protein